MAQTTMHRSNTVLSKNSPQRGVTAATGKTVFLSYSRVDRRYVTKLANWLEGHGVRVWYDHHIDFGSKWETEIEQRLDAAGAVLVVMSKAARRSRWVRREIDRAEQRRIPVLPILLTSDGIVDAAADFQFDNVIGGRMPSLRFCQRLPGFLVRERDIVDALSEEQSAIASRIFAAAGSGLRRGSKGPAVAALQVELLRVGLEPGPINGTFGAETQKAVVEFQRRRCHIPTADGIVGPLTWAILANSSLGDLAPLASSDEKGPSARG